ncbi:hypothetical protein MOB66_04675 [Bacillus haynesii]|uniref:hypothetical protein n=1 Tax=Bacillus haynesii TaxID=1925021 RepID=UPI0022801F87|nr:hypothetical protein [Bacillus haynesii]MCY7769301.1 hypothetical protein [Bacillus haynesii]MCY8011751.1 hypothetical protein [Bacillus haynesii]MCY9261784.1 hypothetical protein [Bacillus haynesii]MEC0722240.1 hypothetical protein [Bacillus haynesii]MEC0781841.1 hypothetical protein [Bacillus haynesii]
MVKKKFLNLCVLMVCVLVITGCGKDNVQEVIYEKGLPKEDSPAFKEFMRYELDLVREATLSYQDNTYTVIRSDKTGLRSYQYTDDELQDFYKPLLSAKKDLSHKLRELRVTEFLSEEKLIQDRLGHNLPEMTLEQKNVLKVKTTFGEKKIKIPVSADSKDIYLDLYAVNKESMLIGIDDYTVDKDPKTYYLFLKQDLSKHHIVRDKKLNKTIESGELKDYLSVFPKVTDDGSYRKLFDKYIFEKKANKVREIKDADYLSEDGKYVYLNGAKDDISDGVQKIQTVENYLKGNDNYEAQFRFDFKKISKKLELKSSGHVSFAQIIYFNEDYVAVNILYNGIIVGTAGSFNVLIDLQKNKKQPTAYMVDLDISGLNHSLL